MTRLVALVACCGALSACASAPATGPARDPLRFSSSGPHRSVTVVETRMPPQITFEQFARNEPKMIRRALHARHIVVRETRFHGRRALRVTYTVGAKRVRQYFVRRAELMFVTTYTYRKR